MAHQIFIVTAINWEYNDEYNYEAGLGAPEAAYSLLSDAHDACDRLNIKLARSTNDWENYEDLYDQDVDLKGKTDAEVLAFLKKHDIWFYVVKVADYHV